MHCDFRRDYPINAPTRLATVLLHLSPAPGMQGDKEARSRVLQGPDSQCSHTGRRS